MTDAGIRRVLMSGDNVGGVWTFTLELAEGLVAQGVDVCLVTFGQPATSSQRDQIESIPRLVWLDSAFKLEWMENPWEDVERSGRWLLEVQRWFNPDVVHLNTLCHGDLAWKVPVILTAHSCVLSWWRAVKSGPLPYVWDRYVQAVKRSVQCAGLVTAPSQSMLASVRENYSVQISRSRTIPNGRNAARFRAEQKEPFIFAAGRLWDEAKNIQVLARIASRLPWPTFLAGDTVPPGRNDEFPESERQNCNFLGRLCPADLAMWLSRAAIYAAPARYEPFGLSILEAALSGCALVLGDIPSMRELWQDAAVFVPSDDPRALEEALRDLISNPGSREAMSARALQKAQRYTPAQMVSGYLNAYRDARPGSLKRRPACAS